MPLVETFPPCFSEADVREYIEKIYGLKVTSVRLLVGDIGQNFHLTDQAGQEFIFKIANPAENKGMLDAQNQAMDYIALHNNSINCPQVCETISREQIVRMVANDGSEFLARMLTFVHGKFLADIHPHTPSLLHSLGTLLGSMDKTLADFYHPAAQRYWHWDLKHAGDLSRYTKYIANARKRSLVEYFLLQFEMNVMPVLPDLRSSIIHNDANDHNVLATRSSTGETKITGIIDFGDMVHSCTIFELAIAIAYVTLGKDDPLSAAATVVRGYHEAYPLTEPEMEVLFYSICTRLAASVTISAYQQHLRPDEPYLSISEQPAWEMLKRLLAINPEKARREFHQACGQSSSTFTGMRREEILTLRQQYFSKAQSIAYKEPLKIIRGAFQYLFDDTGNTFLDCVNNVCHVGHCHPRVVQALRDQAARLNTNTRYLHDNIVEYAERLTATLPDPLNVCFFVNSGSEANDLALRLARNFTGQKDCIVIDAAYHGHLSSIIELSPYKFDRKGGQGRPDATQVVPMPDLYRGQYKWDDPQAGQKYAAHIKTAIEAIQQQGRGVAAFYAESLPGCGGQIVLPAGYLQAAFSYVRAGGGLCIADEVQVGFGRVGSHWWGFETQDVVPDIVTVGKPIGNGHPLAAVITTREIADAFANGMEYFNTFGGNPVSCAVGLAVLDVIEQENLRKNALEVGGYFLNKLHNLQKKHTIIGDVRGLGLFIGVELVKDRETREPATEAGAVIIEQMKARGVLLSTDGPLNNVLKIKPPIVFTKENVDLVYTHLDAVMCEI